MPIEDAGRPRSGTTGPAPSCVAAAYSGAYFRAGGAILRSRPQRVKDPTTLSPLYRQRFAASHAHVSMDLFPNARHKSARLLRELVRALDDGRSVVVDNTNRTAEVRAPLIAAALARGAHVIGYSVEATPGEALARNRMREGTARVPDVAILSTARRLQPPRRSEGFARLYRACPGEDGAFQITEIAG